MSVGRILAFGSFAILMLLLGACEPPWDQRIALKVEDGVPVVVGIPCPATSQTAIRIVRSANSAIGGPDDEVLWEVITDDPAIPLFVPVGTTPQGYRETNALETPLPDDERLYAQVAWAGEADTLGFEIAALPAAGVLTADGVMPEADFISDRVETYCD